MRTLFTRTIFLVLVSIISLFTFQKFDSNFIQKSNRTTDKISTHKMLVLKSMQNAKTEKFEMMEASDKFDEPDKFAEYFQKIKTKVGKQKPDYKPNYKLRELEKARKSSKILAKKGNIPTTTLPWVERGPANVGGRTRGLVVDPDDASFSTWFAGSVGGGIWKTTDAGNFWTLKTPDIPNMATTTLAMAMSNHNVLYAGTGEGFFNVDAVEGDGIFKSTDKGESWSQLSSTAGNNDFRAVNRIVVDPNDENIVVVATNTGIYKSTDGGFSWTKVYSTSRRVQDLISNPSNFNTLYATVNGLGVMKSIDAGDNWSDASTGLVGVGRMEIAIAPTDTSRLYISAEKNGSTLFISMDAGTSWVAVNENSGTEIDWLGGQGWYDNTIAVNPFDENTVFFGGIDIWKAQVVFDSVVGITSVEENGTDAFLGFKPSGLPFLDGGVGTGIDFWDEPVITDQDYVTVEIRFGSGVGQKAHRFINNSYDYQDYVDVPFEIWDITNNKQLMASFKDTRKNGVFDLSAFSGDIIFVNLENYDSTAASANIALQNGQKYKNLYVVTPRNASGVSWDPNNLPTSNLRINSGMVPIVSKISTAVTDGYNQYPTGDKTPHVDKHDMVMIPIDQATNSFWILNGNDGGVAYSTNGGNNWIETDQNGYNTSQFYGADKRPGANEYWGGTQDNGTWQSPSGINASSNTGYNFRLGGDGFEVAWNYWDGNKLIGGSQYNRFWRTEDGGTTWEAANTGFDDWANSLSSPFISKIASSKSDPDLIFTISRKGVWRSDNFGASWTLSTMPASFDDGNYFSQSQVAISIADPQVVWAGASMTSSRKIQVSKDGGLTFTPTNNFSDFGIISGFDTHPTDPATAYALFSFAASPKILRTTDYGNSWADITGFSSGAPSTNGFPDVAVYCLLVMPYDTNILWAGTEIGIVESIDNGLTWHLANNGFPAVSVWDMKIVDDQVVVATHGRGIWSVTLPELNGYIPPVVTLTPRINGNVTQGISGLIINTSLRSQYDSTHVLINNQSVKTLAGNNIVDTVINVPVSQSGDIKIQLESFKNGRTYKSSVANATVAQLLAVQQGFVTDFSNLTNEFFTDGFEFKPVQGFNDIAAHSPHPYSDASDLVLFLKVPIVIASSNATLKYDDVAIIEPGDPGSVFGDDNFWDYVIVEGSNGGNWIPLVNGYDARTDSRWLNAYNNNQNGDATMFKSHTINLLNKFNPGDTVLVRFRMYADQFVTGWGWAIDNLSIQDQFVGVEDEAILPAKYELSQNYPNPFNPTTTIKFALPKKSDVSLKIYNSLGELVTTLFDGVKNAGYHQINWTANVASGVYFYTLKTDNFVSSKKMILLK